MKKFICTVCGYVHEGDEAPEFCPQCKQPKSKFKELVETEGALTFVDEHRLGVAKGVDPEVLEGLRAHFNGECSEVGMYLAMIRSLLACMASMSETAERGSVRTTPSTLASSIASSTASDHEAIPSPSASYSMTDADQFWPPLSRAAVT